MSVQYHIMCSDQPKLRSVIFFLGTNLEDAQDAEDLNEDLDRNIDGGLDGEHSPLEDICPRVG